MCIKTREAHFFLVLSFYQCFSTDNLLQKITQKSSEKYLLLGNTYFSELSSQTILRIDLHKPEQPESVATLIITDFISTKIR